METFRPSETVGHVSYPDEYDDFINTMFQLVDKDVLYDALMDKLDQIIDGKV